MSNRSRQLLEGLQEGLSRVGIHSYFSATDNHILLGVHAGRDVITVQVGSFEARSETFAWSDLDGKFHSEPPAETVAWLLGYAAAHPGEDKGPPEGE